MNKAALGAALAAGAGLWWFSSRARASPAPAVAAGVIGQLSEIVEDAVSAITPGPWAPPPRALPYLDAIAEAEARYSIPPLMLARLLYQESRYRPEIISGEVASPAGALGIAQFMPATAAELGVDPLNPASAIDGAGKYLRRLYDQTGEWGAALAAYNWGIGNVQRRGLDAAPRETRDYVAQIMGDVGLA